MELNEKQFTAGFNIGYILAKHEPTVLTTLLRHINPITSYVRGMFCGQKEFELEKNMTHLNELNKLRTNNSLEKDREV